MGEMFRSDLMTQCDIYLRPEAAYDILSELGELGVVQFSDMNADLNAFQRKYITEVTRCAEIERKLRYIEDEFKKENITVADAPKSHRAPPPSEMLILEGAIEKWQEEIEEMVTNNVQLKKTYLELKEMYHVLRSIGPVLGDTNESELVQRTLGKTGQLFMITGVVNRAKSYSFERMVWRISKGNVYCKVPSKDQILEDPKTGEEIRKVAFLIVCQGETLESRMLQISKGFQCNLYPCPISHEEREDMMMNLVNRLIDFEEVLEQSKVLRLKALNTVAKQWANWYLSVKKMKSIYHTMNLFNVDVTKNILIGRCWVPTRDLDSVRNILEKHAENIELKSFMSRVVTDEEPPTYNRTNKFTKAFQVLINSYGVSTYREVNPGLYTVITFPFLFSLMFGDMGHAVIVVLFAVWMVTYEKSLEPTTKNSEIWNLFFAGRYILLLMGLFSLYAGLIYNDIFSLSINIFGSHWQNTFNDETLQEFHSLTLDPRTSTTQTLYFIGIDPVWGMAKNKIMFENSLKMKFSITIGVIHMMFGVMLSVVNYNYYKHRYSIILEFIPQFLFLALLFFYLVFMMFFKWFKYSGEFSDPKLHAGCAPLVLLLFIDMVLMSESVPVEEGCEAYMYDNQRIIQTSLVLVALSCIPIMLFGKPLYLHYKSTRKTKHPKRKHRSAKFRKWSKRESDEKETPKGQEQHQEHSFGELMIHQGVHTIEYVLSTVSHTASYLRLWALSLAHSQLSEMLWQMVLSKNGLRIYNMSGSIYLVVAFAIWAVFTLAILIVMEGLSAFLHTLRLHWVEFMSKFYLGDGHFFMPFSFAHLEDKDDKK